MPTSMSGRRLLVRRPSWPGSSFRRPTRDLDEKAENLASTKTEELTLSYLRDLLSETREELTRVDNKASLLLAAVGVVLGALIGGLADSTWTPMSLNGAIQWLWWLGTAAGSAGVLSIAATVYPRFYQRKIQYPGALAYYGHIAAYRDIIAYQRALDDPPSARDRLVNQTFVLSTIVRRKYTLLRQGMWCLLLTITACTLAVGISALLGS